MSLITESLYSIPQKSIVNFGFDVIKEEENHYIKITHSDNSYALYSQEINKQLKEHIFYIDKKSFHDNVYLTGGSINETYMEHKEKGMEILLPCSQYQTRDNLVLINNDGASSEFN